MNWEITEDDLAIFDAELDTESKQAELESAENLNPDQTVFNSRESALAASVGDLSGVTARPNKLWRLEERFKSVHNLH